MVLELPDAWVWDAWYADDGEHHHAFYLKASRALIDPERRHWRASVGHAVSEDLERWHEVADALVPSDGPAFDDLAIWTGSVSRDDDGLWWMHYTGQSRAAEAKEQRIGAAVSEDLFTWRRTDLLLEADPRWYDVRGEGPGGPVDETHWRDPYVVRDAGGLWHMYVTARRGRGVVGHATSADLRHWEVRPPLSEPTDRFGWMEVFQVVEVDGRWVLVFSCLSDQMPGSPPGSGGVWSVAVDGPGAPVDVTAARRLTSECLYVGKVLRQRDGRWVVLAFLNEDEDRRFRGHLVDPVEVRWADDGVALELVGAPPAWMPVETGIDALRASG